MGVAGAVDVGDADGDGVGSTVKAAAPDGAGKAISGGRGVKANAATHTAATAKTAKPA
ncbi:hypothetical protein LJR078_003229 [Arthrobacter sp. LjRoot78]|uniref:hypothetical protein n=1 Tax=Arthrobacter sp. LjRoot78 TaxID=3342338 RepID=UPI003ECCBC1A